MRLYLKSIFFVLMVLGLVIAPKVALAQFDVFAIPQDETEKVAWHGYYEFEYWDQEGKNSTFDTHKIVVWMGVKINEMVYLSSELEYEHFPRLGDGDREGGTGEINIDSAQLRITPTDNLTVSMGAFYVPFGIEWESYPGWKNKLVTRPKVMKSGGIIPGTWSDVGLGVNYALGGFGHVDAYVLNGDAKNGGISRDSSSGGNDSKSLGIRLMLDDFMEGVNIGISTVSGEWDVNGNSSVRYGAHVRIDTDKMIQSVFAPTVIMEYITGSDAAASSVSGKDKDVSGYYLQLSSMVMPSVEVVGRFGRYNNDEKKKDNGRSETSAGVVWHALEHFQVKGEYQWNREDGVEKDNDVAAVEVVVYW